MKTLQQIFGLLTCILILIIKLFIAFLAIILGAVVQVLLKIDIFIYDCFLDIEKSLERLDNE